MRRHIFWKLWVVLVPAIIGVVLVSGLQFTNSDYAAYRGRPGLICKAIHADGAQTNLAVWTPASGKRICVIRAMLGTAAGSTANSLSAGDDVAGDHNDLLCTRLLYGGITAADSRIELNLPPDQPYRLAVDTPLKVSTQASNVRGYVIGWEE